MREPMTVILSTKKHQARGADADAFTNVSTYANRLGEMFEKRAMAFICDRLRSGVQELDSTYAGKLTSEQIGQARKDLSDYLHDLGKYVKVRMEDGTRSASAKSYIRVRISYESSRCSLSIPTTSSNGTVRVIAEKYSPQVEFGAGAREVVAKALRNVTGDLTRELLSSGRTKIESEDYGGAFVFMVPVSRLRHLPGVPFTADDESVRRIARSTGFPVVRLDEVRANLAMARDADMPYYLPKAAGSRAEEKMLAASFLCVKQEIDRAYPDHLRELGNFTELIAKRLKITPAQAEAAAEDLLFLKRTRRE